MALVEGHYPDLALPMVSNASVQDYFSLLKPRVMSLVIFTALVGLVLAPGPVNPVLGLVSLLCIAVGAGASGALNMWYDADIDKIMSRTRRRPIPAGHIQPSEALAFGLTLSFGSVLTLGLLVNWLAASLLAFTIFFYVVIYTMWLKRWTAQNIVIGGAAGALPPMIGWAAASGTVSSESVVLFLIIFFWTPPHFWALSLLKSEDYRLAGVPMLPVVAGRDETRRQILLHSLLMVPLGILPWVMGFAGVAYGLFSSIAGLVMLWLSIAVFCASEDRLARAAKHLFLASLLYLFSLFAVLLGEHLLMGGFA